MKTKEFMKLVEKAMKKIESENVEELIEKAEDYWESGIAIRFSPMDEENETEIDGVYSEEKIEFERLRWLAAAWASVLKTRKLLEGHPSAKLDEIENDLKGDLIDVL